MSGNLRKREAAGKGSPKHAHAASPAAAAAHTNKGHAHTNSDDGEDNSLRRTGSKRQMLKDVIWANPYITETDFVDFLYKPRTVMSGMALMGALLFFYAAYFSPTNAANSIETNIKFGLGAVAWAFVTFGMIHLPDGQMVRPHPAIWRAFLAIGILYMCFCVFLIFQDVPTIRMICGFIDPKLRTDLPERSYADDCRLSTPEDPHKWFHTIFDEFLLAHSLGYLAKMLVIRDWRIVTLISLSFEVVEVSLQHILPNFAECWWDHLIIDVLICNAGGTALGYLILKLIGAKRYRWAKVTDIPSVTGKLKRVISQFYPRRVDPYEWQMFSRPGRLLQVLVILAIVLTQEVNSFTMKNILHIPSTHPIVVGRLVVWGMIAIPAVRDVYVFTTEPTADRLGTAAWLAGFTLVFETAFIKKMVNEGGHFQQPMPGHVGLPLCAALFLFVLWFALYYGVRPLRRFLAARVFMNTIFYAIPAVLAFQFLVVNVDIQWKQREFIAFIEKYHLWDW